MIEGVKNRVQQKQKILFCCSCKIAAEQKARAVYDNILRVCDDPDVANVIKYLREREIVHFQRFGGALNHLQSTIKCRKNEK